MSDVSNAIPALTKISSNDDDITEVQVDRTVCALIGRGLGGRHKGLGGRGV
jgi:hypothetical protein